MDIDDLAAPEAWAQRQWGGAELGDRRRRARAVRLGAALAARPAASLPAQADTWGELKAAYRLLHAGGVTHAALGRPHREQTRAQAAGTGGPVLFVQDATDLDFTGRRASGLGPIGDGGGAGLVMHTCLGVLPGPGQPRVLGVAAQKVWARGPAHRGTETRAQRRARPTESDAWAEMLAAVGPPPEGALWVSVGDRGSDVFSFLAGARRAGWHCLARLCQDRVLLTEAGERVRLKGWLRSLPPAPGWCLRCWEEHEAGAGEPALEWLLFTTLPVPDAEHARRLLGWYACRWVIEEYHKCLKSGCAVERRQLHSAHGLEALLGLLAVVAVRLLQLRALSRAAPEQPAQAAVAPAMLRVLAARLGKPPPAVTRGEFWRGGAGLGGFIGRKSDGDLGWQTLWLGWQWLQDMCWGADLTHADAPRCG